MKKITINEIKNAPKDKYFSLYRWEDDNECYCRFCGRRLITHKEGIGRDSYYQPTFCGCEVSRAAEKHNEGFRLPVAPRVTKEKPAEANKPKTVVLTIEEACSVISGRIIPGVEPVPAEDKVTLVLKGEGSAGERLLKHLGEKAESVREASGELVAFIRDERLRWNDDISGRVDYLCEKYNLPKEFTLTL